MGVPFMITILPWAGLLIRKGAFGDNKSEMKAGEEQLPDQARLESVLVPTNYIRVLEYHVSLCEAFGVRLK